MTPIRLAAGAAYTDAAECAPELYCSASKVCAACVGLGAACEAFGCAEGLPCFRGACVLDACE